MYFVIILLTYLTVLMMYRLSVCLFCVNPNREIYVSMLIAGTVGLIGIVGNYKITYNSWIFTLIADGLRDLRIA
jgi:hypothetical protein